MNIITTNVTMIDCNVILANTIANRLGIYTIIGCIAHMLLVLIADAEAI